MMRFTIFKNIFVVIFFLLALSAYATVSQHEVSQLESRIDELELENALNRFKFSGSFMNHFESFYSKNERNSVLKDEPTSIQTAANSSNPTTNQVVNPVLLQVQINMDAYINKNLTFFSRIGMNKFWNLSGRSSRSTISNKTFMSLAGSYATKDSGAHFDVAYLRYSNESSPWSFAIGRMTTNDGPPYHHQEGLKRSGTYPFMSYNTIFDGTAIIYNFANYIPQDHKLKMRLFYTPFITVDDNNRGKQKVESKSGDNVESNATLATLLTEYSISNLSSFKKIEIYHSIYHIEKIYDPTSQKLEGPAPAPSFEDYYNTGVDYVGTTSNTILLGANGVLNSRFDFSYTVNTNKIKSSGSKPMYSANQLATVSYSFNNKFFSDSILGLEYLKTDANKFPTDSTTIYVNEFYNMADGNGTHIFYTMHWGANQIFRLGNFNYKTRGSKFLNKNIDSTANSTYFNWKVLF